MAEVASGSASQKSCTDKAVFQGERKKGAPIFVDDVDRVDDVDVSRMGIDAEVHERSLALREVGAGMSLFANDNGRRHRLAKDNIRK